MYITKNKESFLSLFYKTNLNWYISIIFITYLIIAILLIYKNDIIKLIKNFFLYFKTKTEETRQDFKYCWLILLGSIPIGIIGFTCKDLSFSVKISK